MGWDGPILTDSGGFQVFSLAANVKITDEGAVFRSHLDGNLVEFSPERAVAIQEALGSDVAMLLDHVVALPNAPEAICDAMQRSIGWARARKKCIGAPIKRNSRSCKAGSILLCESNAPRRWWNSIFPAMPSAD